MRFHISEATRLWRILRRRPRNPFWTLLLGEKSAPLQLLLCRQSAPLQLLLLKLLLLVERSEREALLSSTRNPSMRRTPGSQMMENRLGWQGLPGKFWMRDGNLATRDVTPSPDGPGQPQPRGLVKLGQAPRGIRQLVSRGVSRCIRAAAGNGNKT